MSRAARRSVRDLGLPDMMRELEDLDATRNPVQFLNVSVLTPRSTQPRWNFEDIEALAASIIADGVLQPLLVRPRGEGQYEVVAGERRWRASRLAAESNAARAVVPCVVRQMTDEEAHLLAMAENLQRQDLNAHERAQGVVQLLAGMLRTSTEAVPALLLRLSKRSEGQWSVEEQAQVGAISGLFERMNLGQWQSFTKNQLPLLRLDPSLVEAVRFGQLPYTKARALDLVQEPELLRKLLQRTLAEGLSVREIQALVRAAREKPRAAPRGTVERLRQALTTRNLRRLPAAKRERAEELMHELEALFGR